MAFRDSFWDLIGGIAQAAGYGCIIYFVMYWIQWNQSGNRGAPPILETVQQQAQQQVDKKKKDKRSKPSAKGLGGGLGPVEPSTSETAEEDEGKMQPNQKLDPKVMESIFASAQRYQEDLGDDNLTTEHLVLAMAQDQRFGEILSVAEGLDSDGVKKAIKKSRVLYNRDGNQCINVEPGPLEKYTKDLTAAAREGKLDPVVGRNEEIRRCINILSRRTKNNPVLLGESGVGKTAVVEGLCHRIADGDVPDSLRDVVVVSLDMGVMMAGASFPGEFEERLKGVLKELTNGTKQYILFIDDIHTMTGPNAQQGGGVMDASILLKPLLSRGELRCVGCTTLDKFRKFIEKDPALERRFQQVQVEPTNVAQTVSILRGLRSRYEAHHGVKIADSALQAAASMSDRYLPDRYLPDKAIDLMDEAAARVKMEMALRPEALDKIERRIREIEFERQALVRSAKLEKADAAELVALEAELAELREKQVEYSSRMEQENSTSGKVAMLQDEIDRLSVDIEAAEAANNRSKAAQLKKDKFAELVKKLRAKTKTARKTLVGKLSPKEVTDADMARVISRWTGIPLTKLVESERDKLLHLGQELHKRIIGQEEAVEAVAEAIQRSRAGMKDPNGPIASFLFLGPTGVGKTELAKALASYLFNAEDAMVRIDMSEYMEKHAVSKLIGAPPGYVGFDEGGQLTEPVRRKPYTVVLFDEVEKAHVDVFNLLLQILDDGRVTDSQGRTVSFKNAIIILTSNLGSQEIYQHTIKRDAEQGGAAPQQLSEAAKQGMRDVVMAKVRKHFTPEFINRIDEFIIFEPLAKTHIRKIVRLRLKGVEARIADKKMKLQIEESALDWLAGAGYDPVYGARPVKRAIQRDLETPLARALLMGAFQEDDTVVVEATQGASSLTFSRITGQQEGEQESEEGYDSDQEPGPQQAQAAAKPAAAASSSEAGSSNGPVKVPVAFLNSSRPGLSSSSSGSQAQEQTPAPAEAPAVNGTAGKGFDPLKRGGAKAGKTAVQGLTPHRDDPRADHTAEKASSSGPDSSSAAVQQGGSRQAEARAGSSSPELHLGSPKEPEGPNTDDYSLPPCPG